MSEVVIRTVPASPTAVVAGPFDLSQLTRSYDTVYDWLRGGQTEVQQTGQNIALYRHGTEMEIGVEVDHAFEAAQGVIPSQLPGGRVACAVHTTGFADMRRTYELIESFCRAHGHEMTGIAWEIYGDPDEHAHVDVEIRFLLR